MKKFRIKNLTDDNGKNVEITLCQTKKKQEDDDCNDVEKWIAEISLIIYYKDQFIISDSQDDFERI